MTNKLLNTGSLLFLAIVAVALLFNLLTSGKYKVSNARAMDISLQDDFIMNYGELDNIISSQEQQVQFIDLRDLEAFSAGHIPGAVCIPLSEILDKPGRKIFRESAAIVLYAEKESLAAAAAQVLAGKGYTGIRIVAGGYSDIEQYVLQTGLNQAYRFYKEDKAQYDYPRFMNGPEQQSEDAAIPQLPGMKTEVITVQGGC